MDASGKGNKKESFIRKIGLPGKAIALALFLLFTISFAQATTYILNSNQAANASIIGNWWTGAGGTGIAASNFTSSGDVFVISSGTAATFGASTTFSSGVTLQVDGTFTIAGGNNDKFTVTINGIIEFNGTSVSQAIISTSSGNPQTVNTFALGASGTLRTKNTNGIAGANCSISTISSGHAVVTLPTTANYEFNGAAQSMTGLPATVSNLIFSGSGLKTFSATVAVTNSIIIATGVKVALTTITSITSGALYLGGTLQTFGTCYGAAASTCTINTNYFTGTTGKITVAAGIAGTWTGATNTDWATSTNWFGNSVPATNAIIPLTPNQPIISAIASCNTITINTGATLTNNNSLTVATALAGTGGLINASTGTLNIGGTSGITTLIATASGNTVNYNGATQIVMAIPYSNLTLSGSGVKTLQPGTTSITGNFSLNGAATATAVVGLTIGGNVTIGTGTTFSAGSFTHNVGGNWTKSGGTFTSGTSTINFNGTGTQSINSGGSSFNTIYITNTTGTCIASSSITASSLDNGGPTNLGATIDMATFTLLGLTDNTNAKIRFSGASNGIAIGTGTVEYYGTGQTVMTGTYNNLTLSNTSGKETASGVLTVDGTLTTTSGGILDMGINQLLGALSTIANGGTIQTQNTTTTPIPTGKTWGGTVNYNATSGGQTVRGTFSNLSLSNTTGTQTASSNLSVNGTFTTTSGGTLDMGTYQLLGTLSTIANGGTIQTQNTTTPLPIGKTWGGIVNYNGSGAQTVSSGTYSTLKVNNTAGATLGGASTITSLTIGDATSNSVFNDGAFTVTTATNLIITSGTYYCTAASFPWGTATIGGTVNYSLAGDQNVAEKTYNNLTLSGSGSKTLQSGTTSITGNFTLNGSASTTTAADLPIGGNLDIGSGCKFTIAANNFVTVNGTITNSG